MKKILCLFILLSFSVFGKDKTYTQEDFDKKVNAEVERQINLIKKKSIAQLTKELLEKDAALNAREKELDQRAEQIGMNENSLTGEILKFEKQKAQIIGCMEDHEKTQLLRVKQLVSVISNMRPQKAAELLSVQESQISVKLLQKIDPEKASKIFNLMDKEVSARLQKQYLNMQQ